LFKSQFESILSAEDASRGIRGFITRRDKKGATVINDVTETWRVGRT
jgi:hypothetical protein